MGDCRIRIQHDVSLDRSSNSYTEGQGIKTLMDQVFASDSTVQELLETTKIDGKSVLHLISESNVCLWDCTVYPPMDVSKQFDATTTLYTVGWFPSARLQILPKGKSPVNASFRMYDNEPDTILQTYGDVKFVNRSGQVLSGQDKPSQLLQTAIDFTVPEDEMSAKLLRSNNRQKLAQKQRERLDRLQKQIESLETKSNKTSLQVRNMLIKSRATGKKTLQDRIYFKCFIVIDDNMTPCEEDYRFFSPQDTVGKVVESFAQSRGSRRGEFIVGTSSSCTYGRLPLLMRLYEAKAFGYIEDFMTVIIRFYDPDTVTETLCVNTQDIKFAEEDEMKEERIDAVVSSTDVGRPQVSQSELDAASSKQSFKSPSLHLPALMEALVSIDAKSSKKALKPCSTTVDKVKQMQMKSKAKGDGKRVKHTDRFYFELVVASKDYCIEKVQPVFLAQSDPLSRILRDHVGDTGSILLSRDEGSDFRLIDDTSISLEEASKRGILAVFGRVIVYKGYL